MKSFFFFFLNTSVSSLYKQTSLFYFIHSSDLHTKKKKMNNFISSLELTSLTLEDPWPAF